MKTIRSTEGGQILVLLALVLIGLLGFTALAVDGGMIFADQRYSQSSADAASLAGGGAAGAVVEAGGVTPSTFSCGDLSGARSAAVAAAIAKAGVNDYIITEDNALGPNTVRYTCDSTNKFIDVEVVLSRVTNTSFVHLFTGKEMRTTVYSKTRVLPQLKAGAGAAIVSLGMACNKQGEGGVHFDSGSLVTILTDGGVYSNSCVFEKSQADVTIETSAGVPMPVDCHVGFDCDHRPPEPNINTGYHPLTNNPLPSPGVNCSKTDPYVSADGSGGELFPGNYSSWDFKDPVRLNPGLYCVTGTVRMTAGGEVFGDRVTIFYTGTDLTINGHLDSELSAPNSPAKPPINGAVEDILLYVPPDISAEIKINGNSNNIFGGTMYAPASGWKITGTSDSNSPTAMNTSIIGKAVWISGTSYINIKYDEDMDAGWPAYIQIQN